MIPRYLVDFDLREMTVMRTKTMVIGSGIAGLFSALQASLHGPVVLMTKKKLLQSNTQFAQGGIAAVMTPDDSPEFHKNDTLNAGAGLCNEAAVQVLVQEGPSCVQQLIDLGTRFDQESDGKLAFTKEGAHSHRRILHCNGDATGAEIVRALSEQVQSNKQITLLDHHFAIDLLTEGDECRGALIQSGDGERFAVLADATVLCSGGAGQLYRYTTNPEVATGDGVAIAYRAGAVVRDMEFIQFHPTALYYPGAPRFLISEAVRGEGAVLRNIKGERFMTKYDALAELAPRDIVARAIVDEMAETGGAFVYLDITHQPAEMVKQRFPTIYHFCLQYGLDLTSDWIPVAPAAHYMMGGVKTDLNGETSIKRLYACGEVSSTGVHGANRLASNSLSEALVFARRIAKRIAQLSPVQEHGMIHSDIGRKEVPIQAVIERRLKLQKIMLKHVGVKRHRHGLKLAQEELGRQLSFFNKCLSKSEEFEFANLLTCAMLVTTGALAREESRGGHFREDFPERNDKLWKKHVLLKQEEGIQQEGAQVKDTQVRAAHLHDIREFGVCSMIEEAVTV